MRPALKETTGHVPYASPITPYTSDSLLLPWLYSYTTPSCLVRQPLCIRHELGNRVQLHHRRASCPSKRALAHDEHVWVGRSRLVNHHLSTQQLVQRVWCIRVAAAYRVEPC